MNRRNFLKFITAVCGAAVVCPGELLKGEPEKVFLIDCPAWQKQQKHDGVTNEQLRELIQATLRDLPKMHFENAFIQSYELCRNNKEEYYPGLGLSI